MSIPSVPPDPYSPPVSTPAPAPPTPPVDPGPVVVTPPATPPTPDPTLPLRTSSTIQGNVLAAFNKDHQSFRLLTFPPDPARARQWLTEMVPQLAVTEKVETWNEEFSAARKTNGGVDPAGMVISWLALSLTAAGIELLAADPQVAGDLAAITGLVEGPAARAAALGDVGASDPSTWLFGGPTQPVIHAVVTIAADVVSDLDAHTTALEILEASQEVTAAFVQDGNTLPGDQAGHEHFGFRDGISQPGVVGFHAPGADGARTGHPGTALVAGGNFVFGQPTDTGAPRPAAGWLTDGSVHVLRRLEQNVPAWSAQPGSTAQVPWWC